MVKAKVRSGNTVDFDSGMTAKSLTGLYNAKTSIYVPISNPNKGILSEEGLYIILIDGTAFFHDANVGTVVEFIPDSWDPEDYRFIPANSDVTITITVSNR